MMAKINLDQEPTLREKVIFGVVAAALLIFFMNSFWSGQAAKVRALRTELKGLETQTDAIKKLIDTAKTKLIQQQGAKPQDVGLDESVRRMLERKISDPFKEAQQIVELLGSRKIAKKAEIMNILVGQLIEEKNYSTIPITVEVKGRYTSLESYMKDIEDIERPLVMKKFGMHDLKDTPGVLNAKLEMNLLIAK